MALNIINFSNGIRSEEIQENFNILQDEINRERINIGGTGVASGLDITPIITSDKFAINISAASIITKTGEEIHIKEQIINIEKPRLISNSELLMSNVSNQVTLKELPYSIDRLKPSQYSDAYLSDYSGITINYQNSTKNDDNIRIKSIDDYTLTLTGLVKRAVKVNYYYSAKRIDTIYIDDNNKIQVKVSSITSSTPSAILPESYKYLIAYILVDPYYQSNKDDIPHASIIVRQDLRDLRNIYTDINGDLYLCGTAFKDLQFISLVEPLDPKENQLWLNVNNNTLYMWKRVYNTIYRKDTIITDGYNGDYSYKDFETDIKYNINLDEFNVYVNKEKLDSYMYCKLYNDIPIDIQEITNDKFSNKFRVYKVLKDNDVLTYSIKIKQSIFMWVPINKESYVNSKEIKIFGVDDEWENGNYWSSLKSESLGVDSTGYKNKYKYFLFDYEEDKRCLYTPGRNELSIMINQIPLHSDQFEEITLYDAKDILPSEVFEALQKQYHYDDYVLSSYNDGYDNIGIGFMLKEPLDALLLEGSFDSYNNPIIEKDLYVEAFLNRTVSEAPSKRKLQRFATYVYENTIKVDNTDNSIIDIQDNKYYRFNENQLEVFINGIKLIKDIDFEEGSDLNIDNEMKDRYTHSITKQFKILKAIHIGDIIQYKITSNFLNYDHIDTLLNQLDLDYSSCVAKIDTLYDESQKLNENTFSILENVRTEIEDLKKNSTLDSNIFLTTNSVLKEENLPNTVINNLVQSLNHISAVLTYSGNASINITDNDIRQKDYVHIIHRDTINNKDSFLIRDVDYFIDDMSLNDSYTRTELSLTNNFISQINMGDKIIITGIKFGRDGR